MSNRWNRPLIKKYGKTMKFKDLPMGAKMALVWWLAFEGEAWDKHPSYKVKTSHSNEKRSIITNMKFYEEKYGNKKWGLAMVPASALEKPFADACKANSAEWDSPKNIKEWVKSREGIIPNHKTADYPCIFGSFDDDNLFEDGWHRFSCYMKKGVKVIPCLY